MGLGITPPLMLKTVIGGSNVKPSSGIIGLHAMVGLFATVWCTSRKRKSILTNGARVMKFDRYVLRPCLPATVGEIVAFAVVSQRVV